MIKRTSKNRVTRTSEDVQRIISVAGNTGLDSELAAINAGYQNDRASTSKPRMSKGKRK
jgi:hypothetical protein